MIKVYAIDDHKLLIESFAERFKQIPDIDLIGYALSGKEAICNFNHENLSIIPDVILLDIGLGDMTGIECAKSLLSLVPNLKIIGLSTYMQGSIVKKMMKAGAKGYISKATDIAQLEDAIRKVAAGENFMGSEIQNQLMNEIISPQKAKSNYSLIPQLTKRETEVLREIADELSTKEIAEKLFISINTVETHRKNLISKFNVKNSVGLVRKAIELNLLD